MAKIDKRQVEHVALLARLKLTKKEIEEYAKELSSIIDWVEILSKAKLEKIKPISQITDLLNVVEEDMVKFEENKKELLKNIPLKENGFIKVKRIIE